MTTRHSSKFSRLVSGLLASTLVFTAIPAHTTIFARDLTASNTRYSVYGNDPSTTVGEGINAVTGNFAKDYTDFDLSGSQTLKFVRSYNAANAADEMDEISQGNVVVSPLGAGWRHNYEFSAERDANSAIITMNDGVEIVFQSDFNGGYLAPVGVDYALENKGAGLALISPTKTEYNFDFNGNLTSIVDIKGKTTDLTYNNNGQLTSIQNSNGVLNFLYTGDKIVAVTDGTGRSVTFDYDASGNLTAATNVSGNRTSFYYDNGGYLSEIRDNKGTLTLANEYDAQGRVTSQTKADGE